LRKDLQKKNMQNNSKVLDDIVRSQRPHHDKSILGYNEIEKGSSSKKWIMKQSKEVMLRQSKDLMRRKKRRSFKWKIIDILHLQEDSKFRINRIRSTNISRRRRIQKSNTLSEDIHLPGIKQFLFHYVIHVLILGTRM
jgi:hypothetical protein